MINSVILIQHYNDDRVSRIVRKGTRYVITIYGYRGGIYIEIPCKDIKDALTRYEEIVAPSDNY